MIFNSYSILNNIENQHSVLIETSITEKGLPTFEIFGLVSKSVEESKHRIITAFESSGCSFPLKHISVNLSPAEILKEGSHFDLSIAASILSYTHNLSISSNEAFIGELSFDGSVRGVKNIFYLVLVAKELGFKKIFIPEENLKDIYFDIDVELIGVKSLLDLIYTQNLIVKNQVSPLKNNEKNNSLFLKIMGNSYAKKVLSIAVAGKHNLLMTGFPGVGKSMLAKAAKDLIPDLDQENLLYLEKIYSYLGIKRDPLDLLRPPFRNPHSSSSYSAIFGTNGNKIYPGEVTLSHNGILFLDEIPEFNRLVIEGLRSPLEDKIISISRGKGKVTFPCNFLLIATSNPCKCGYFNHTKIACKCLPNEIVRYQNKLSGPIRDRIDIFLSINNSFNLNSSKELDNYSYSDYIKIKEKIKEVSLELNKFNNTVNSTFNEGYSKNNLFTHYNITNYVGNILNDVQERYSISPRKILKILNISKTISLFNGCHTISLDSFLEAINLAGVRL